MNRRDLTTSDLEALVELLDRMADKARETTLHWFRNPSLSAANKDASGFDPVTQADHATEAALREMLSQARPEDAVLGEEMGAHAGRSGLTWIIDPIDGTRAYLAGSPTWGVLIALADADGPFLGVIDQPYIGERFLGGPGMAQVTGPRGTHRLATRRTERLSDALLASTFPEIGTDAEHAAFQRVAAEARLTRYGMDCYAYALLAAGQIDLVIEAGLNAYDIAAPIAVIEAAGGVVTDWKGRSAAQGGQVLAAANPVLHAAALARLNARPG